MPTLCCNPSCTLIPCASAACKMPTPPMASIPTQPHSGGAASRTPIPYCNPTQPPTCAGAPRPQHHRTCRPPRTCPCRGRCWGAASWAGGRAKRSLGNRLGGQGGRGGGESRRESKPLGRAAAGAGGKAEGEEGRAGERRKRDVALL